MNLDNPSKGADGLSYTIRFCLSGWNERGNWGYMRVIPEGNFPDFDEDGIPQMKCSPFFIFEQIDETSGSFQAITPMATLSSTRELQEVWGGGVELSFTYRKPDGDKEGGCLRHSQK